MAHKVAQFAHIPHFTDVELAQRLKPKEVKVRLYVLKIVRVESCPCPPGRPTLRIDRVSEVHQCRERTAGVAALWTHHLLAISVSECVACEHIDAEFVRYVH